MRELTTGFYLRVGDSLHHTVFGQMDMHTAGDAWNTLIIQVLDPITTQVENAGGDVLLEHIAQQIGMPEDWIMRQF